MFDFLRHLDWTVIADIAVAILIARFISSVARSISLLVNDFHQWKQADEAHQRKVAAEIADLEAYQRRVASERGVK